MRKPQIIYLKSAKKLVIPTHFMLFFISLLVSSKKRK